MGPLMGSDSALAVRKKEFDPPRLHKYIFAHSSNGKTEDFESSNPGSSPGWASKLVHSNLTLGGLWILILPTEQDLSTQRTDVRALCRRRLVFPS